MISQTAEYALRAIVYLAMNPEGSHTTQQISVASRVPAAYLSKVLQALVRARLVHSHRGLGGGFNLSKSPDEATILEVLNAVDPIQRIQTCPLGLKAHGTVLCALHRRLDEATAVVEEAFRSTTIGDLLASPTKSVPLCDSPCEHFCGDLKHG